MKTFLLLVLLFVGCVPTFQMRPKASITENLNLFDFYSEYGTDYEVETIAHHYMTGEDYPDAFGHILVDFDNVEVPIYVWKESQNLFYWYKSDPYTGEEYKTYLTKEQIEHIWSFN